MTDGTSFERNRTYITKMSVPAFAIIEALDVIKNIGFSFVSSQVARAIDTFTFE